MRLRSPLIAAVVVLAAAIVLLLLRTSVESSSAREREAREERDQPRALPASSSPLPGALGTLDEAARRAEVAASAAAEVVVAAERAVQRGVELLALDAASAARVMDAELLWWPQSSAFLAFDSSGLESLSFESRLEETMSARAEVLQLDAEGRWSTPAPDAVGYAIARSAHLWGHAFVGPNAASPVRIWMHPDQDVRVRVVDQHGTPLPGARVALRTHSREEHYHDIVRAFADDTGVAVLRHARALAEGASRLDQRHSIALGEPFLERIGVEVELEHLPRELVELVVPASGVVEVEVLGASLSAQREPLYVSLALAAPDAPGSSQRYPEPRECRDGLVCFPFVELGRDVIAWTLVTGGKPRVEEVRAPGPVRAGQTVRLTLRMERHLRGVSGRLVDARGALLEREFDLVVGDAARPDFVRAGLRTDAQGRFAAEFGVSPDVQGPIGLHLREGGQRIASAQLPLSVAPVGASTELGDVRVAPLDAYLAGVVQYEDGAPARGALVTLYTERPSSPGSSRFFWRRSAEAAECDAHGRFRFTGAPPTERLALRAQHRARRGAPQIVESGQREIVLRVDDTGAIHGRALLPATVLPRRVSVAARAMQVVAGALDLREPTLVELEHDGRFALEGLCAGGYELQFRLEVLDPTLADVPNVLVRAGESSEDPRLTPIDLRAALEIVTLEVRDADGAQVDSGMVGWRAADGEVREAWVSNGRLVVQRSWGPGTAWIAVDEHLLEPFDPTNVSGVISLRRAPRVRLRLPAGAPALADEVEVWAALSGSDREDWLAEWAPDELHFSRDGVAEGFARRTGKLNVKLWIAGEHVVESQAPIAVSSATPGPALEEFVLSVDLEELARALQAAGD